MLLLLDVTQGSSSINLLLDMYVHFRTGGGGRGPKLEGQFFIGGPYLAPVLLFLFKIGSCTIAE